jgi:putative protein kinase ArgK-like GTPase of G3E family
MPHPIVPSTESLRRRELDVDDCRRGVLAGDRATLGRAITLIESVNPEREKLAKRVLAQLTPRSGWATRVGIRWTGAAIHALAKGEVTAARAATAWLEAFGIGVGK